MHATPERPRRLGPVAAAVLVALILAVTPGCGEDEGRDAEKPGTATSANPSPAPEPSTEPTEPETAPTGAEPAPTEPEAAPQQGATRDEPDPAPSTDGGGAKAGPEDRTGGVGDEAPALSQALFSGRDGRVAPPLVRVPPFIAIRARLRSADGAAYALRADHQTLRATGRAAGSATFDGLRPGRRIVLEGPNGRVVIEASAEPGP